LLKGYFENYSTQHLKLRTSYNKLIKHNAKNKDKRQIRETFESIRMVGNVVHAMNNKSDKDIIDWELLDGDMQNQSSVKLIQSDLYEKCFMLVKKTTEREGQCGKAFFTL